ncbi:hypothetical protein Tco_0238212 [Tanacetum coccineum]
MDRLPTSLIGTWALLEKGFIQRYFPPYKTVKHLEDIDNFKKESDETLYHAWERGMHLDKECPLTEEDKRVKEVKHGFGRLSIIMLETELYIMWVHRDTTLEWTTVYLLVKGNLALRKR